VPESGSDSLAERVVPESGSDSLAERVSTELDSGSDNLAERASTGSDNLAERALTEPELFQTRTHLQVTRLEVNILLYCIMKDLNISLLNGPT
jgi:hypothetical protein